MSDQPKFLSINTGAISNDFRPIMKVPSGWGGITIVEAKYITETAGTSTVQLVDLGTTGTAVASGGTLFSSGSAVAAPGVPVSLTLADTAYLGEGHYLGVKEANIGTTGAISIFTFSYLDGK